MQLIQKHCDHPIIYCILGGGAIEMELSKFLREYSKNIVTKDQSFFMIMARAFEVIPRQLADNAGFDATNILNKLRRAHALGKFDWNAWMEESNGTPPSEFNIDLFNFSGETWFGVDIMKEDVEDNYKACVWEPSIMKINAISAAIEAACLILSVDETIKSPQSAASDMSANNPYAGKGMM